MAQERELDLILWGATGFTGRLTAEYLAAHPETRKLRWALGGRSESKLRSLRDHLAATWPSAADLPLVVGDAMSEDDMGRMAARTKVVVTLVGPFAKYGDALVAACAAEGTHYCDTTGEPHWIRPMIDQHHETARKSGARIVNSCGYDSVPGDLGTLMLQEYALEHFGTTCEEVIAHYRVGGAPALSGGTVDSMVTLAERITKDRQVVHMLRDPYCLDPRDDRGTGRVEESYGPRHDDARGLWTAPFMMAVTNERLVRRSNALLGHRYGRAMRYMERMPTGPGAKGFVTASVVGAALALALPALTLSPVRSLARRYVLPKPGEGPSAQARAKGWFTVDLRGRSADGGLVLRAKVAANGDPGYGETATMLGESGLCLALDALRSEPGISTPAAAMGQALIERLKSAGHTYEVEVESAENSRMAEVTRRQQAQSLSN